MSEAIAKEYKQLQAQAESIKSRMAEIKVQAFGWIDKEVGDGLKGAVQFGSYQLIRQVRQSQDVNEERMLTLLCAKVGATLSAVKKWLEETIDYDGEGIPGTIIKLALDEAAVQEMVKTGYITQEEFTSCIDVGKAVPAFNVKEVGVEQDA